MIFHDFTNLDLGRKTRLAGKQISVYRSKKAVYGATCSVDLSSYLQGRKFNFANVQEHPFTHELYLVFNATNGARLGINGNGKNMIFTAASAAKLAQLLKIGAEGAFHRVYNLDGDLVVEPNYATFKIQHQITEK